MQEPVFDGVSLDAFPTTVDELPQFTLQLSLKRKLATVKGKKVDVSSVSSIALTRGLKTKRQLFHPLWWQIYVLNSVVNTK